MPKQQANTVDTNREYKNKISSTSTVYWFSLTLMINDWLSFVEEEMKKIERNSTIRSTPWKKVDRIWYSFLFILLFTQSWSQYQRNRMKEVAVSAHKCDISKKLDEHFGFRCVNWIWIRVAKIIWWNFICILESFPRERMRKHYENGLASKPCWEEGTNRFTLISRNLCLNLICIRITRDVCINVIQLDLTWLELSTQQVNNKQQNSTQ